MPITSRAFTVILVMFFTILQALVPRLAGSFLFSFLIPPVSGEISLGFFLSLFSFSPSLLLDDTHDSPTPTTTQLLCTQLLRRVSRLHNNLCYALVIIDCLRACVSALLRPFDRPPPINLAPSHHHHADVKQLTQNPQVTSSRHWKYYVETNEWTRATCALMACLFSRDQMANSTVLGRGGSQRERLPTNLVAYVVSKCCDSLFSRILMLWSILTSNTQSRVICFFVLPGGDRSSEVAFRRQGQNCHHKKMRE